jgi:undecaprenyl-diphosphatase
MEALKAVVARPRPALWPWLVPQAGFSFPSGHALAAASFYPVLAWEAGCVRPLRRRWFAVLAALGVLWLGLGRLYLGVHWPSDVLAGWALGAAQSGLALAGLRAKRELPPAPHRL